MTDAQRDLLREQISFYMREILIRVRLFKNSDDAEGLLQDADRAILKLVEGN